MKELGLNINVKVPKAYNKKKYINAIGMGVLDLACGYRPQVEDVAIDRMVSVRIKLSPKAAALWEALLPKYGGNVRRLAREALCLVSQEPEHCLKCRI